MPVELLNFGDWLAQGANFGDLIGLLGSTVLSLNMLLFLCKWLCSILVELSHKGVKKT